MGSGDRVKIFRSGGFGCGVTINNFPYAVTVNVLLAAWIFSVGFGKAYDK